MADVKIKGKSKDRALNLLALADKLGLDRKVIKSQNDGYLAPEAVAKELEELENPKPAPKKKATAKSKADDTKEGND